MIIAIDGTSGSGKSTVAKSVSEKLSIELLNTGLLYRKITKYCLDNSIPYSSEDEVINSVDKVDYSKYSNNNLHSEDISINKKSNPPAMPVRLEKAMPFPAWAKCLVILSKENGNSIVKLMNKYGP